MRSLPTVMSSYGILALSRSAATCFCSVASIRASWFGDICTAGCGRNALGAAYSRPSTIAMPTSQYFQRGKSIMGTGCCVMREGGGSRGSGRLDRALGHDGRDGALLYPDLHVVRDFEGEEMLADVFHAAQDAGGDHLVALGQVGDHLALFLLALRLRADEEEIERRDHHHVNEDDRRIEEAAGRGGRARSCLRGRRRGGGDDRSQHEGLSVAGRPQGRFLPKRRRIMPCTGRQRMPAGATSERR